MDFLKNMFKCSRKLSHLPSGRVLKCLSWTDVIPQLSQQMSQEGGGGLFLLSSRSPLGTAEGLVLPTSRRLSHGWNWVRWGQVVPKAGVLLCFAQKKSLRLLSRGCCRWSTWVQYQGWQVSEPLQVPTQICCGWHSYNGTLGPKPHPPTSWMVWFIGMEKRLNKAWGLALPICLVLVCQCQDPLQDTVTNTLSNGSPPAKPGFSASWK